MSWQGRAVSRDGSPGRTSGPASSGTARVWDPHRPHSELAHLALLGTGYSSTVLDRTTMAVATSRGFLVFELRADENLHGQ